MVTLPDKWIKTDFNSPEYAGVEYRIFNGHRISARYNHCNASTLYGYSVAIYEVQPSEFYIAKMGFAVAHDTTDPLQGPFDSFRAAYCAYRLLGFKSHVSENT